MSAFSAAASDEDDDIIQALRAKNEEMTHQIELLRHVAQTWKKKAEDLEAKVDAAQQPPVVEQPPVDLESVEQYRLQMAAISTAALGYWKEGDSIHPDYDTLALRDVAKLYAKYTELFNIVHGIT